MVCLLAADGGGVTGAWWCEGTADSDIGVGVS